jgi:hypothetical protein
MSTLPTLLRDNKFPANAVNPRATYNWLISVNECVIERQQSRSAAAHECSAYAEHAPAENLGNKDSGEAT